MATNQVLTVEDIIAITSLDECDVVAAGLTRKAFPSVKYAGNVIAATDSAIDPSTPEAKALAWLAVTKLGLSNAQAAERFGFHHPRAVRQAKYAYSDGLGVDLRVRRAKATTDAPAPEAPAPEPEAPKAEAPKAKAKVSSAGPPAPKGSRPAKRATAAKKAAADKVSAA